MTVAADHREGLLHAAAGAWELLVIHHSPPEHDGGVTVRTLRSGGIDTPVLVLSRTWTENRQDLLAAGADDCMPLTSQPAQLAARVAALGRRPNRARPESVLRIADLEVDLLTRTAMRTGRSIELQPREFQLLEFLVRNAGTVLTRTTLLRKVWAFNFDPQTNVVESHISRLRAKIDRGHEQPLIHTLRGRGYCLKAPD